MKNDLLLRLRQFLRRDGWILAVLLAAALGCILLDGAASTGGATQEEARLAQVLSQMEGAGRVDVAIHYSPADAAVPCGAVIVAEGAGDVAVRLRLIRAVKTLLGIEDSCVEVFQREGGVSHGRLDP